MPINDAFGEQIGVIEDLATPIVGYRLFHRCSDLKLRSVTRQIVWPSAKEGGLVAECLSGKNEFKNFNPPCDFPVEAHAGNGFGCGIYAAKSIEELKRGNWGGEIIGRVLLGGRVHEHASGYRAEFAAIDAIYITTTTTPAVFHPSFMMPSRKEYAKLEISDWKIMAAHYDVPLLDFPQIGHSPNLAGGN